MAEDTTTPQAIEPISDAEAQVDVAEPKKKQQKGVRVATFYNAFHINRNIHEAKTGPVTIEEQIKAIERHTRWHERQAAVGAQLLANLRREKAERAKEDADAET